MKMKNCLTKTLSAAILSAMACSAMAANENVDVKVIGEIIPAACVPAVTGGAIFDYGSMSASKIAADDFTVLGKLSKNFTITCDAAVKIGIRMNDARQASAVSMPSVTLLDTTVSKNLRYGLGEAGGKQIGAYALQLRDVQLDGQTTSDVTHVFAQTSDSPWTRYTDSAATGLLVPQSSRVNTWYTTSVGKLGGFKTLSGVLNVQAAINKGSELDLSQKVTLDGLANLEVVYL